MVFIEQTYLDKKTNQMVQLMYPRIHLNSKMGEGEQVIVTIQARPNERSNKMNLPNGMFKEIKSYDVYCVYQNQRMYAKLTEGLYHKLVNYGDSILGKDIVVKRTTSVSGHTMIDMTMVGLPFQGTSIVPKLDVNNTYPDRAMNANVAPTVNITLTDEDKTFIKKLRDSTDERVIAFREQAKKDVSFLISLLGQNGIQVTKLKAEVIQQVLNV